MKLIELALTERQAEIFDEVMAKVDETAAFLTGLSREERLDWLKEHQYCHPISFEREIGGTVYTINAHFSDKATETLDEKAKRILNRNIAH